MIAHVRDIVTYGASTCGGLLIISHLSDYVSYGSRCVHVKVP